MPAPTTLDRRPVDLAGAPRPLLDLHPDFAQRPAEASPSGPARCFKQLTRHPGSSARLPATSLRLVREPLAQLDDGVPPATGTPN